MAFPRDIAKGRGRFMNEYFNRRNATRKRQMLRGSMPDAEVILWSRLKGRQLLGCKFRRQYSVGAFVIDFHSPEIKLGIEVDGESHFQPGAPEYDRNRQGFIESFGIKVVRVLNTDVYENLDGVMEMIAVEINRRGFQEEVGRPSERISSCSPPPTPPSQGGEINGEYQTRQPKRGRPVGTRLRSRAKSCLSNQASSRSE